MMSAATLTITSLNVKTKILTVTVSLTVQNVTSVIRVNIPETKLIDLATADSRTDWTSADVCAFCSEAIGITVTLPA